MRRVACLALVAGCSSAGQGVDGGSLDGAAADGSIDADAAVPQGTRPFAIQADFIDVSRIVALSKFRSLAGHDFSGGGETCRSMKHYFHPQETQESRAYQSAHNGLPQPPNGIDDIPIYSPIDGVITKVESEQYPVGRQIRIEAANQAGYAIRLFHIWPRDGLDPGNNQPVQIAVTAGEKIGVIAATQGTDIAIEQGWGKLVSYFELLPDSLFAAYQARGVQSRADVILTKEYRDAHAVACEKGGGQQFTLPAGYDSSKEDYVYLSGYVANVDMKP